MCMCLLFLPSSDLTLGKNAPLHLTPFLLLFSLTSKELDSKNIPSQEQRSQFHLPAESGWRRSVFSIYPTFCLSMYADWVDRVGQHKPGDEWPDLHTDLVCGAWCPGQRHHHCHPKHLVILGCLLGKLSLDGTSLTQL